MSKPPNNPLWALQYQTSRFPPVFTEGPLATAYNTSSSQYNASQEIPLYVASWEANPYKLTYTVTYKSSDGTLSQEVDYPLELVKLQQVAIPPYITVTVPTTSTATTYIPYTYFGDTPFFVSTKDKEEPQEELEMLPEEYYF